MHFEIAQRAWMAKVGKPMAAIDPRPYAEQVMSMILPQVKAGFPAVDQKRVKAKMGEGTGFGGAYRKPRWFDTHTLASLPGK